MDGNCLIIVSQGCQEMDNFELFGNEMEMTTKQRSQANARERFRTHRFIKDIPLPNIMLNQQLMKNFSHHSVNSAFNTLRLLIPTEPKNRKLSKIETLRLAKSYIAHLHATLAIGNGSCRQPCFEASPKQPKSDYRTNICTFCVSSVIHQKRLN